MRDEIRTEEQSAPPIVICEPKKKSSEGVSGWTIAALVAICLVVVALTLGNNPSAYERDGFNPAATVAALPQAISEAPQPESAVEPAPERPEVNITSRPPARMEIRVPSAEEASAISTEAAEQAPELNDISRIEALVTQVVAGTQNATITGDQETLETAKAYATDLRETDSNRATQLGDQLMTTVREIPEWEAPQPWSWIEPISQVAAVLNPSLINEADFYISVANDAIAEAVNQPQPASTPAMAKAPTEVQVEVVTEKLEDPQHEWLAAPVVSGPTLMIGVFPDDMWAYAKNQLRLVAGFKSDWESPRYRVEGLGTWDQLVRRSLNVENPPAWLREVEWAKIRNLSTLEVKYIPAFLGEFKFGQEFDYPTLLESLMEGAKEAVR